jgi:hypothetical protein
MNFLSQIEELADVGRGSAPLGPSARNSMDIPSNLSRLSGGNSSGTDYNSIFSLVRKAVKTALGKERVGLGLALADLPSQLGAFWEVGGNYIVMNKNILDALRYANRPKEEINSFVFVILMHEYLHSLGVLDEYKARTMTARICATIFEEGHPAYEIGTRDPWQVYPFLLQVPSGNGENLKIIGNFDSDTVSYIM